MRKIYIYITKPDYDLFKTKILHLEEGSKALFVKNKTDSH